MSITQLQEENGLGLMMSNKACRTISQITGQKPPVASVLARLAVSPENVDTYLNPLIKNLLPDPKQLLDVSKAAERLIRALDDRKEL